LLSWRARKRLRVDLDLLVPLGDHDLLPAVECGVVLAGVQAKPWRVAYGQP
jgi:hypothetical protein